MIAEDVSHSQKQTRPACAGFCKIYSRGLQNMMPVFLSHVVVRTVRADSIMELLTLCASQGSQLHIRAEGREAHKSLEALRDLINNRFGEEE